jgi:hypothetical protein
MRSSVRERLRAVAEYLNPPAFALKVTSNLAANAWVADCLRRYAEGDAPTLDAAFGVELPRRRRGRPENAKTREPAKKRGAPTKYQGLERAFEITKQYLKGRGEPAGNQAAAEALVKAGWSGALNFVKPPIAAYVERMGRRLAKNYTDARRRNSVRKIAK